MKLRSTITHVEVIAGVIYEILAGWLGNLLWKSLGLENNSLLTILPPVLVGLLLVAYWSKHNEEKVKNKPFEDDVVDLSMKNNLSQSGIMSLIPLFFFWCGDKTLITQSLNVLVSFAPFALGVYKTEQIRQMVGRLYNVAHNFLEKLSQNKHQVKIRERWLYKYLREHNATRGIDDIALKHFVTYKLHLWKSERSDTKLSYEEDGLIAEVQPKKV
jgi:hypothetical protein